MNFEESDTKTNLARSFAGECQAGARYQFMSKVALQEQMQFLSDTMKTLAKNEMAHAKIFYDLITAKSSGSVRNIPIEAGFPFEQPDIKTGLFEEVQNEIAEAQNIYPNFARIAKDEGFEDVAKKFEQIAEIENHHAQILEFLANHIKNGKLYKRQTQNKWKCSNCGYVEIEKEAWKTCPVCDSEQGCVIIDIEKELSD